MEVKHCILSFRISGISKISFASIKGSALWKFEYCKTFRESMKWLLIVMTNVLPVLWFETCKAEYEIHRPSSRLRTNLWENLKTKLWHYYQYLVIKGRKSKYRKYSLYVVRNFTTSAVFMFNIFLIFVF